MDEKVVIDSYVLESLLKCLNNDIPIPAYGWETEKIEDALRSRGQFSVVEWHKPSERATTVGECLVRFENGRVEIDEVHPCDDGVRFKNSCRSFVKEWTHMPV